MVCVYTLSKKNPKALDLNREPDLQLSKEQSPCLGGGGDFPPVRRHAGDPLRLKVSAEVLPWENRKIVGKTMCGKGVYCTRGIFNGIKSMFAFLLNDRIWLTKRKRPIAEEETHGNGRPSLASSPRAGFLCCDQAMYGIKSGKTCKIFMRHASNILQICLWGYQYDVCTFQMLTFKDDSEPRSNSNNCEANEFWVASLMSLKVIWSILETSVWFLDYALWALCQGI